MAERTDKRIDKRTDNRIGKLTAEPAVELTGTTLRLEDVVSVACDGVKVTVGPDALDRVRHGRDEVESYLKSGRPAYGINTGFGSLCDTSIPANALAELQQNLVRSHASGVGGLFPKEVVRAAMLLRANSLCRGNSGVRPQVVETLVEMLNRGVIPLVHQKGSLGASGDLAPLADLALVLTGEGKAWFVGECGAGHSAGHGAGHGGECCAGHGAAHGSGHGAGHGGECCVLDGAEAMKQAGIEPLKLQAKEGLALLNGTAFMTAVAVLTWARAMRLMEAQNAAAALSLEAFRGTTSAYSPLLLELRPHRGAMLAGAHLRGLVQGSKAVDSANRPRIQDPYSFRCVPQVHGTAITALMHVADVLSVEINSATDNPLVVGGKVINGGNFHGQPVGAVMDYLCIAMTSMAAMSERRTNQLMNPGQSGLPAFLIADPGLNSGYMIPQYSAASLVNEARVLSNPASVQSIPVCNDQEDHISMATAAASKAAEVVNHAITVAAVELLAAAQALDLRANQASPGSGDATASDIAPGVPGAPAMPGSAPDNTPDNAPDNGPDDAPDNGPDSRPSGAAVLLGGGTKVVFEAVRKVAPYVAQDSVMSGLIENVARSIREGHLAEDLHNHGYSLILEEK